MSETLGRPASEAIGRESRDAAHPRPTLGAADWPGLAAAPTFAIMALLTSVLGGGAPDRLCPPAQDASPLSGMIPMYLLMSAFHSAPWLKLICGRGSRVDYRARPEGRAPPVDWTSHVFWRDRFANLRTLLKEIDP
jgi:hypothetical protein